MKTNYYIDYNLESTLLEKEGKRLMIELYYQFGVMLMLLDRLIPSIARERMVVCYCRYKSASENDMTRRVAVMCKTTQATFSRKDNSPKESHLPPNYPSEFFRRF